MIEDARNSGRQGGNPARATKTYRDVIHHIETDPHVLAPFDRDMNLKPWQRSSPDKAAASTRKVIADWDTERIRIGLAAEFHRSTRVSLVRPWWLPPWLYSRLMRSIVVEAKQEESR